jgi:predicted  nucleic acid-binding Zn-ribbon protein
VSEVLAEQLRAPGFRTVERGYDQESVRDHLAVAHALVTQLERAVVELERRADDLEGRVARAEAGMPVPEPEDDELLAVVFDGQRRADELAADAEAAAVRVLQEADERVAALRDDSERRRLAALVEERQAALAEVEEVVAGIEDDLHVTGEATRACREAIGDRLAAALADLREMATSTTERT